MFWEFSQLSSMFPGFPMFEPVKGSKKRENLSTLAKQKYFCKNEARSRLEPTYTCFFTPVDAFPYRLQCTRTYNHPPASTPARYLLKPAPNCKPIWQKHTRNRVQIDSFGNPTGLRPAMTSMRKQRQSILTLQYLAVESTHPISQISIRTKPHAS
jgi:hypothetical protein